MSSPHLIFQIVGFKLSEDYDYLEVSEYHQGTLVSFQHKVWVDYKTHLHGIMGHLKPIHDIMSKFSTLNDATLLYIIQYKSGFVQ